MPHIRIELLRVYCGNTEDTTGADEFYVVGALTDGTSSKGALTSPISINDNQEKGFDPSQRVIFDANVTSDAVVRGGLKAFDEDFAKDWTKYGPTVTEISNQVSQGLKSSKDPKAIIAGEVLNWATKAFGILASLDQDDKLGSIELNVPAQGPIVEEQTWNFQRKGSLGISTWNYSVVYRITREGGTSPFSRESDRYMGVWQQSTGPTWVARHGLTGAQYQAVFDDLTPKGYRPLILNGYSVNGQDRYLGVWQQSTGPAWVARHGLTSAQYQAVFDDLTSKGYRPTLLSGYSLAGSDRYLGVFERSPAGGAWVARHGLTGAQYQAVFDDLTSKGYRPTILSGYSVSV